METKIGGCPLGAKCEEVKDDIMYLCPWYMKIRGSDPNTGADIDEMRCAIAWTPLLLIENSMHQRSTGAAVESFRNEMVQQNQNLATVLQDNLLGNTKNIKVIGNDEKE